MRLQKNNGGFTLIELIVVITILAILGTIAFISLQGYSADARNSKRLSDINSISSAMWIKQTEGVSLMNLVTADPERTVTGNLAGVTIDTTSYTAGQPNYTLLGIKESEFSDPSKKKAYLVGVTTTGGGRSQFVSLKEEDGDFKIQISGNFVGRQTSKASDTNGTITDGSNKITMTKDLGRFKVGDTVNGGKITSISDDMTTLTTKDNYSWDTLTKITLAENEVEYLVEDRDGAAITAATVGSKLY